MRAQLKEQPHPNQRPAPKALEETISQLVSPGVRQASYEVEGEREEVQ